MKRRTFMQGAAIGALAVPALTVTARVQAQTAPAADTEFVFEVIKTEDEWRAQLGEEDFRIMRMGKTEKPRSSPLWYEVRAGDYHCKACDLHVYESKWKTIVDVGWVFFTQNVPNSVLMGIDESSPYGAILGANSDVPFALIEAHCRRCGGHFGHITLIDGQVLHCLDGASLNFVEKTA
ncbi:MAG: peptide-methionine (R)-S-oxide reductase [Paracoccaceae bacterium]|nr:peptide-methionine (R)-S-oxide reductase [Paracoccaceae bacterium]